MKKIILVLMLCLLSACGLDATKDVSVDSKYESMIELLTDNQKFVTDSNYYDINSEIAKIDDGYRYYVYIDNPRVALYNVEALAIEDNIDYSRVMAANIGIFEEESYHLVPNQTNVNKGYVKGLVMSGVSENEEIELKVLVCWEDKTSSQTNREYFKLKLVYGGESNE